MSVEDKPESPAEDDEKHTQPVRSRLMPEGASEKASARISHEAPDEMPHGASLHPALEGVRAVIFDVGGTLVHPDWARLAGLAGEAGHRFAPEDFERAMKEVLKAIAEELQAGREPQMSQRRPNWIFRRIYSTLGVGEEQCSLLHDQLDASHRERHLWCMLDPAVLRLFVALRGAGLRLAVISNTEDGRLAEILRAAGIDAYLDLQIDSYVVGVHKPDPAIFHLALSRLGLAPHEAVYVGDSYGHDVLPALALGMRAVLIDPLDMHPESACSRVRSLSELIR